MYFRVPHWIGIGSYSINEGLRHTLMLNYKFLLERRGSDYGVPVALLDSSSLSFSGLNSRLKNAVSLSFVSFESFEESAFVLLEDLGLLNYQNRSCYGDYLGISSVLRAVVSLRAVASCSSRLRSYGPRVLGMLTLKSIR